MAYRHSRRLFLSQCAAAASGSLFASSLCLGRIGVQRPMKRVLGRTGIEVTTLGLGGQASIQRTRADINPAAIIGIGHIDSESRRCQLEQNLSAAQVLPESLSATERVEIEQMAGKVKGGETNWFQHPQEPLSPPRDVMAVRAERNGSPIARLSWQTAYAADHPIRHYEIACNGRKVAVVEHRPQTTKAPFTFETPLAKAEGSDYTVTTVDASGRRAASAASPLSIG